MSETPSDDPYYYCQAESGGWAVGGPDGFTILPPGGLDKNIAFALAKVLSGKAPEAVALLLELGRLRPQGTLLGDVPVTERVSGGFGSPLDPRKYE